MKTHGLSSLEPRAYSIWMNMRNRCFNEKTPAYKWYGARGVTVCPQWNDFAAFLGDMGSPPSDSHSLDRWPNKDGNYEPGNCRWATMTEQQRNRRNNTIYEYEGKTATLGELCEITGVNRTTALMRLKKGATIDRALRNDKYKAINETLRLLA